jgi:predicted phosphodiesterase
MVYSAFPKGEEIMRSYSNKEGISIEVSKEHLDTAVQIKKELQNLSPSRKCSWRTLVRMMEQEGFDDAENSENYRQMVKSYQKSIGELPTAKKTAELVASDKLESIKNMVGEMAYEKREAQLENAKLNKAKREIINFSLIVQEIKDAFSKMDIQIPELPKDKPEVTDRSMLVLPSDWHIGYMNNSYNHKNASERVNSYLDKVIEYADIFNINKFHVVHLGDIIEHLYMHKNSQSFNAEFTMAEQIVKATELLFMFLTRLSLRGEVVFHGVVQGNHGRMSTKGETVDKDCAEFIVHETLLLLISAINNDRLIVDDSEYNVVSSKMTIHNKRIKATHGDFEGQNDKDKIQKHMSLENQIIDILTLGHFHNFQIRSENHGRLVYGSGCLQGSTHYSEMLKYGTPASQGIIILSDSEVIPINIMLGDE